MQTAHLSGFFISTLRHLYSLEISHLLHQCITPHQSISNVPQGEIKVQQMYSESIITFQ